ncbi:cellulose binding domain-containing protein, partial [Micromonospora zhanjiangensis]
AAAATPDATPAGPTCRVDYALRRDTGRGFDADVQVTNSGEQAVPGWRLTFAFPGDQVVTGGTVRHWQQQGRSVAVRADDTPLAPGRSATMALSGRYADANPLPVEFRLNDSSCAVRLSGVPGVAPTTGAPTPARTSATGASGKAKPAPAKPAPAKKPEPRGKAKGKDKGKGGGD